MEFDRPIKANRFPVPDWSIGHSTPMSCIFERDLSTCAANVRREHFSPFGAREEGEVRFARGDGGDKGPG